MLPAPPKNIASPIFMVKKCCQPNAPLVLTHVCFFIVSPKKNVAGPYREIAAKLIKYLKNRAVNDFWGGPAMLKKKLKSKKRAGNVFFGGW